MSDKRELILDYEHYRDAAYESIIPILTATGGVILIIGYIVLAWLYGWPLPKAVAGPLNATGPSVAEYTGAFLVLVGLAFTAIAFLVCVVRIGTVFRSKKLSACMLICLIAIGWCLLDMIRRA